MTSSFSTASSNLQYLDSLLGPVLTAKDTGLCPHTVVGSLLQSLVLYSFLPGGVEELPWTRDMKVTLVAQFCWEPLHSLSESTAEVKYTQYKSLRRFCLSSLVGPWDAVSSHMFCLRIQLLGPHLGAGDIWACFRLCCWLCCWSVRAPLSFLSLSFLSNWFSTYAARYDPKLSNGQNHSPWQANSGPGALCLTALL